MGLFNFLKTGKRALDAQMDKAAESIEQENAVEFGKQEIEQMKTELRKIRGNIGTVKGEMAVMTSSYSGFCAKSNVMAMTFIPGIILGSSLATFSPPM